VDVSGLVIIGVGNPFRSDDGVGPRVIDLLHCSGVPQEVLRVSLGETTQLIDFWEGADLAVLVDAIRVTSASPGRVHRLTVIRPSAERSRAEHGLDLGEAVELARVLGRLPGRLVLYAIEVAEVGYGDGLSAEVEVAAREVADRIAAETGIMTGP